MVNNNMCKWNPSIRHNDLKGRSNLIKLYYPGHGKSRAGQGGGGVPGDTETWYYFGIPLRRIVRPGVVGGQ